MPILNRVLYGVGIKSLIICITISTVLSSCYNHLRTKIPYDVLKTPVEGKNCSASFSTFYIKAFYNTSFTRYNGDTVFHSKNPNVKFNKIYADEYLELLIEYLKALEHKVILLPKAETTNGPYLESDLNILMDSLNRDFNHSCSDTATILWFMNRNTSHEYEMAGTSIGNIIDYQSNLTSYALIVCNGNVCFVNGLRTHSWYGPTMQYYKITLQSLFDPFFNPTAKMSRRLVVPTTRVN